MDDNLAIVGKLFDDKAEIDVADEREIVIMLIEDDEDELDEIDEVALWADDDEIDDNEYPIIFGETIDDEVEDDDFVLVVDKQRIDDEFEVFQIMYEEERDVELRELDEVVEDDSVVIEIVAELVDEVELLWSAILLLVDIIWLDDVNMNVEIIPFTALPQMEPFVYDKFFTPLPLIKICENKSIMKLF